MAQIKTNLQYGTTGTVQTANIHADAINDTKIADDIIGTEHFTAGEVDQTAIANQAINEAKMQISNSPTNGHFLSAQSGNTGGLTWAEAGGGGKINQVLQKFKADSFSTTSTSYTEISSFRQAITPSASNSKILLRVDLGIGMAAAGTYWIKLHRVIGSSHTNIGNNTIDGNEDAAWGSGIRGTNPDYELQSVNLCYLDSPSTTAQVEYYVVVRCDSSTLYVGQVGANTSRATTSVMTVMEVLA